MKSFFSILALSAFGFLFLETIPAESPQSSIATEFQHTTAPANISANSSALDHAGLNGNPKAIVMIYPVGKATLQKDAVGVWYDGTKWRIFNENRLPMSAGLTYRIVFYEGELKYAYTHRATPKNASGSATTLDHPLLVKNDRAVVHVTQVWNPGGNGGIYNESNVAVEYQPATGHWVVRNLTGNSIPDGAAFNIDVDTGEQAKAVSKGDPPPENKKQAGVSVKDDPPEKVSSAEKSDRPDRSDKSDNADKAVIKDPHKTANTIETPRGVAAPVDVAANAENVLPALNDLNLGFENPLLNWTPTGDAFSNQPVSGNTVVSERVLSEMQYDRGGIGGDYWKRMVYPIGIKGDKWIGTYENGNGDSPTGTLTSRPMRATRRYLTFLLGGGKDINRLYVELQIKKSDYAAVWGSNAPVTFGDTDDGFTRAMRITPLINSDELYRYNFDLQAALGEKFDGAVIRISIVDNKTGSWGHINVDDFVFANTLKDQLAFTRSGFGLRADPDKPVFGFADTHAHWVNHVGLRGLMHGLPGGNWRTSDIRRDVPASDGFNHNLPTITPGMLIAQTEKAAFKRVAERLADPGNAACAAIVSTVAAAFGPSGQIAVAGASLGAAFGALGSAASEAKGSTGALDGLITGTVWGLSSNVAFQSCGYLFAKDMMAKHYGNNVPANRPEVSNYVDFPRWNSFFHQTMHVSQVRRSYEGRQRLMVVPVGVAKSWEFSTFGEGETFQPAKAHVETAVAELKRLVEANSDWMAIALTSRQAREIILSGKMAVVIALEQAEVGSYFANVDDELEWLEQLGVRHVFPIHNIDNSLGGAAVFNSALNSYNDLVNRASPTDSIVALAVREGNSSDETRTSVKLDRTFMRQDFRFLPIAGFGNLPFFYSNDVPRRYNYDGYTFHKNAIGLKDRGTQYIARLMRKRMIIDVDHMSDLAQDSTMRMLSAARYPMISGHTNFRDLRRDANATAGDKEPRLRTEFTIYSSRADEINNAGGMFGLMTQQNNVLHASGSPIINNAAGGTPSFAQAYWYALQKTGGSRGIAFGTDFNGFAPQTTPRFGVDAGYYLQGDDTLNTRTGRRDEQTQRRAQAFAQRNGVRYDVGIMTYHYHRFLKPEFLSSEEREIWEAIAIAKSGVGPRAAWQPGGGLSVERTGLQQEKIRNLAEGFQARPTGDFLAFLDCPEYPIKLGNDCMPERKAAFMAVHGPHSLPSRVKDARTMELFGVVNPIYELWMRFENGPNEPLRRSFAFAGGRDFDFNLDGLAHYGLLPDMIQDMKNIGFTPTQLQPLFKAPEEYLQIWAKTERAGAAIH